MRIIIINFRQISGRVNFIYQTDWRQGLLAFPLQRLRLSLNVRIIQTHYINLFIIIVLYNRIENDVITYWVALIAKYPTSI